MPAWLKWTVWILGLMIVCGLAWSVIYTKQAAARHQRIKDDAIQRVLSDAPLGSDIHQVVDVLKSQRYDSTWDLDEEGILTAVSEDYVLEEFTWTYGPTSWDLLLRCRFSDQKLSEVTATMRPTGL